MGFSAQVQNSPTSNGKGSSLGQEFVSLGNQVSPSLQQPAIDPSPKDGSSGHIPDQSNGMPSGKGDRSFTYSPTSGQQSMGSPNPYPNTVGPWDNANIQPLRSNGKGKGV